MIPSVADRLFGVYPVLPTPFHDDQSLDLDGLGEIVDRLLAHAVPALMLLGSQSEVTYLTDDEQCRLVEFAKRRAGSRALLLVGLVQFGTAAAVEQGKRFGDLGADALAVALPQQYETPFPQVVTHFSAIVRDVALPTLYYHYPEPTHLRLTPERIGALFGEAALVGIQNGALDTDDALAQIREVGRPIAVFSGSSFDCLACLDGGAAGSVCPEVVLMPKTAVALVAAHRAARTAEAEALQSRLIESTPIVSPRAGDGPIFVPHAGVKEALVASRIIRSARIRAPQSGVPEARLGQIRDLAARLVEL